MKGRKNEKADSLESFAKRIERAIQKANVKDQESIERIVCQQLTSPGTPPQVKAMLACKWAEWRYGKVIQPISGKDGGPIAIQLQTNTDFADPHA
jgi:hypothetical protein